MVILEEIIRWVVETVLFVLDLLVRFVCGLIAIFVLVPIVVLVCTPYLLLTFVLQPRRPSNHAMERTATRRVSTFCVANAFSLRSTRALSVRRSSCSR
jgi:predicted membrane metal-binding protein